MLKGKTGRILLVLAMALVMMVAAAACSSGEQAPQGGTTTEGAGGGTGPAAGTQPVSVHGAGATFPYPLYSKWMDEYHKLNPNITVNYDSIGSGGGIKGITEKTVDFAGSDAPMSDKELAAAPGEIIHIPTVMGAVVVTYNLPGISSGMKLDGQAVSDIFMGKIKKWNDPKLKELNPDLNLPDKDIAVVHRSDGSGTTYTFTDYLTSVSQDWAKGPGKGKEVQWPVGIGAKGNEGVSGQVSQVEGAIGYVELAYAIQNNLPYAYLKNQAGKFVEPSIATTTAAAAGAAANMPEDMRVSIVNAPGDGAYPIATYTYLLIYQEQDDQVKGKAVVDFAWWAVHDGEKFAADLLYAPLPDNVVKMVETKLQSVTYQGKPLL
ncbi:MAG: phosphate ABC transporter substrate-binding protein PstS [Clostridia bacterium]|nr:MAG: phosphate ABC transporter substrate-binding protein PstS [Clostridia bacterium]